MTATLTEVALLSSLTLGGGLLLARWLRNRPARAHAGLLLAVWACLALPAARIVVRQAGWGWWEVGAASTRTGDGVHVMPLLASGSEHLPGPGDDRSMSVAHPASGPAVAPHGTGRSEAAGDAGGASIASPTAAVASAAEPPWIRLGIGLWGLASALGLLGLLRDVHAGRRRVAGAAALDEEATRRRVATLASRLGLRGAPRLCRAVADEGPAVWPWSRPPVLLLPRDPVGDAVLLHELAHLRRRDGLAALLAALVVVLLPWQPLGWLARRRLASLAEQACDDWALEVGADALDYADELLVLSRGRPTAGALTVVGRSSLARRLARLVSDGRVEPRVGRGFGALLVGLTFTLVLGCAVSQPGAGPAGHAGRADEGSDAGVDDQRPPVDAAPTDVADDPAASGAAGRPSTSALARLHGREGSARLTVELDGRPEDVAEGGWMHLLGRGPVEHVVDTLHVTDVGTVHTFEDLPAGEYSVSFSVGARAIFLPERVRLEAGERGRVVLTRSDTVLHGRVLGGDEPLGGGTLTAIVLDGPRRGVRVFAEIGTDGRYAFDGLPPGRTWLQVSWEGHPGPGDQHGGAQVMPQSFELVVPAAGLQHDLRLGGATLHGRVDGPWAEPEPHDPVAEWVGSVHVYPFGRSAASGNLGATVRPDGDGRFVLRHLPPGAYNLRLFGGDRPTSLVVPAHAETVEVRLARPGPTGSVRGALLGAPWSGERHSVGAVPWVPGFGYDTALFVGDDEVDLEGGRYRVAGLPPGRYALIYTASDRFLNHARRAWVDDVRVTAGAVTTVDITRTAGREVSIPVIHPDDDVRPPGARWRFGRPAGARWTPLTVFGSSPLGTWAGDRPFWMPLGEFELTYELDGVRRAVPVTVVAGDGVQVLDPHGG